jgi:hypothetical protein
MIKVGFAVAVVMAALSLTACAEPAAVAPETPTPTASGSGTGATVVSGDGILIETRITDARAHTGEVLAGSVLGESVFCLDGTSSGSSKGPTITTTFTCPDGTLTVQYSPTQFSLVQSSAWEVVTGTGSFEGLRGGGSMVAAFETDNPDSGREVFTGTVSN